MWPKLDIRTVAPAPNMTINFSYIPKNDSTAPNTVKRLVKCPGVNFVLSKINCPKPQTDPANKNANKKLIKAPQMIQHG